MKNNKAKKVHADMLISEILELIPESVDTMLDSGLHCVGCGANSEETLREGMMSHDFSEEEIEKMVADINALTETEDEDETVIPSEADFQLKVLEEGNKKYYQIAGLSISEKAYKTLHDLADKKGLQIKLSAGGCAGYNLKYDFQNQPESDEKTYQLSENLSLYINDFTFSKLKGAFVDFESGLHGSGLKFVNISSNRSCSCGTSFNF